MTNKSKIWMDGKLVNWEEANVHVLTHGLHYGGGVFEGIRIYNTPNPFAWMETISLQGKTNFFEARVSEYARAGVLQESTAFALDDDF